MLGEEGGIPKNTAFLDVYMQDGQASNLSHSAG